MLQDAINVVVPEAPGGAKQFLLQRVRIDSAQAERQLHDLTRHAFIAMAERMEQQLYDQDHDHEQGNGRDEGLAPGDEDPFP